MSLYIKSFWITSSEQSPRATFLVKDIKPQQTQLPTHYPLPFFLINRTLDSVQDSTVLSLKLLSQTPLQLALPFDSIRRKQQLVTSDYWENYCFLASKGVVLRSRGWEPPIYLAGRKTLAMRTSQRWCIHPGSYLWTPGIFLISLLFLNTF